ncbi:amidohydrolase family protein [Pigmentiphaga soli]|uniref:Amidohydrolase family protein n=1 Tax=Pigmentiphaga soli TaxID=1007095 RepID=A0ABP8GN25_9BURK
MQLIDSQIHVWLPNTPDRPWPPGAISRQGEAYSIEQALALLDEHEVSRAILVPPSWVGFDNSYALEAARQHPDRFAVIGRLDITAADARQRLASWLDEPGMLGIRMMLNDDKGLALANDPRHDWFWAECERTQMPLKVFLAGRGKDIHPLLGRHPGLRIILDHSARDPRGQQDEAAWADLDDTLALADYANVSVKVSSLPCFSSQPYPFPVLHEPIRKIYEAFGAQRMLWGSDFTRLTVPYEQNIRLFTEGLAFLTRQDVDWIMGKSAAHWCGWKI